MWNVLRCVWYSCNTDVGVSVYDFRFSCKSLSFCFILSFPQHHKLQTTATPEDQDANSWNKLLQQRELDKHWSQDPFPGNYSSAVRIKNIWWSSDSMAQGETQYSGFLTESGIVLICREIMHPVHLQMIGASNRKQILCYLCIPGKGKKQAKWERPHSQSSPPAQRHFLPRRKAFPVPEFPLVVFVWNSVVSPHPLRVRAWNKPKFPSFSSQSQSISFHVVSSWVWV